VPLVTSLLTAIVRANGDALVLHAGERPYVVAPTGQLALASRALTLDAVKGMLNELLSAEARQALDEIGAVQHDLASPGLASGQTFSVVAARGGDDIWIEIRRHRAPVHVPAPVEVAAPAPPPSPARQASELEAQPEWVVPEPGADVRAVPEVPAQWPPEPGVEAAALHLQPEPVPEPEPELEPELELDLELEPERELKSEPEPKPEPELEPERELELEPEPHLALAPEPRHAVVLPLSRHQVRGDQSGRCTPLPETGIDRLLRIAAARGASTLYLTSQARPAIRVDGEISAIEGESTLSEADVEALIIDMIPERNREALHSQAGTEWICDVADVGRIRCVTFRDHRGAGGIFRMIPARAISAEQLGLSREIRGLCAEADGLVLVAGGRSSGKSTLISAFVDLINRTRSDHVITIENQIKFVHDNRGSLVSQREVRGDRSDLVAAARAALRENPDVLVVEDFGSPEMVALALEAAQSGHLVLGALTAHTATDAVDRIIDQTPPERRAKVRLGLAKCLRGIVAQVLLRKTGSGRVAAREVLLNTSAVANLIAEGKTSQLPMAIDSGRKHGMVALNDALVAFVQGGIVDSHEAHRQAADQQGFLALLKRQGIDTSFVERRA
jgi:twitching motility protein PilT